MAELHILGRFTPHGATQLPPRGDDSNSFFLFQQTSSLGLEHEEEIYFSGKTVVWSSGQCVKKSFTLDHEIIQVVWTSFVPNGPRTDLCVLHTEGIQVFNAAGQIYSVVAPSEIERMWPLPTGLLLERASGSLSSSGMTMQSLHSSSDAIRSLASIGSPSRFCMKDDDIPTLFSLMHPLEEVKPLAVMDPQQSGSSNAQINLVCSPSSRVVFSSSEVPLLVMYDSISRKHSLCILRRDIADDADLSYELAKENYMNVLRDLGIPDQQEDGFEPMEVGHDRNLRAALLKQEYLIRPDIFLEKLNLGVSRGLFAPVEIHAAVSNVFLCAGELPTELGLCFVLEDAKRMDCYYVSQDSLKVRFGFSIPCVSAIPLLDPSLVVQRQIAPGRFVRLSRHFVVLQEPKQANSVSVFYRDRLLTDFALSIEFKEEILASVRQHLNLSSNDGNGEEEDELLYSAITPYKLLKDAHATPLRTPQEAYYRERAPESPFRGGPLASSMDIDMDVGIDINMDMDFGSPLPKRTPLKPSAATKPITPIAVPPAVATPSNAVISELLSSCGTRFSIRVATGDLYRVSLSLRPASTLMDACLQALQFALPAELFHDLLAQVWSDPLSSSGWPFFCQLLLGALTPKKQQSQQHHHHTKSGSGDSENYWEALLGCEIHLNSSVSGSFALSNFKRPLSSSKRFEPQRALEMRQSAISLVDYILVVFEALHLTYEEQKLNNLVSREQRFQLASLLSQICYRMGWYNYIVYYRRDHPIPTTEASPVAGTSLKPRFATVPDIFSWIFETLEAGLVQSDFPLPAYPGSFERLRKTCRIIASLVATNLDPNDPKTKRYAKASGIGGENVVAEEEYFSRKFDKSPHSARSSLAPGGSARSGRDRDAQQTITWQDRAHFLLMNVISEEFSSVEELNTYPWAIAQPVREVLYTCRRSPNLRWPRNILALIGREDLALQQERPKVLLQRREAIEMRVGETDLVDVSTASWKAASAAPQPNMLPNAKPGSNRKVVTNPDGIEIYHIVSHMRFSRDNRLEEVGRLLRASKPIRVHIEDGVTERELVAAQQVKLYHLLMRQLALSVGRGAFTLGADCDSSDDRMLVLTEKIHIPPISLGGKLAGSNAGIQLEGPHQIPAGGLAWSEFHNGVAAGLRVAPEYGERVTSDWISYNRPKDAPTSGPASAFAGFLLSMGLLGHLKNLAMTKVYEFLTTGNPLASVAILLGLPATHYGSQSTHITRMISVHVPALHPSTSSSDLDLAPIVQSSALVALGLLHAGSSNRHVSEVLMSAIIPPHDMTSRESYALSAGIGLGWVNLAAGHAVGLADLKLADKLVRCINGGKLASVEPVEVLKAEGRSWLSVNSPAGTVAHGQGLVSRGPGGSSRGGNIVIGASNANGRNIPGSGAGRDKPSLVLEGEELNTDITAPAAVIALGLMYLKSEDAFIASQLQVPDTLVLLDQVRPDVQLLRTCCKNLVMWSSIEPSEIFIQSQMPSVVVNRLMNVGGGAPRNPGAAPFLFAPLNNGSESDINDIISLRHTYIHVAAGSCLAVAFKYAGSHHGPAAAVCKRLLTHLMKMQKMAHVARTGKVMLDLCINVTCLSWSIIMSGSGDLDALRHFRKLRKRIGADTGYGTHMAISMAIGFLFLGGGRYTFGTTNKAIAALLVSVYPLFPGALTDSRYHSQALRHLYVLAVESRSLAARDVDTLRSVYVPVDIYIKLPQQQQQPSTSTPVSTNVRRSGHLAQSPAAQAQSSPSWRRGSLGIIPSAPTDAVGDMSLLTASSPGVTKIRAMLPCLLPPLEWIVQIDVVPDRYWPVSLRPNRTKAHMEVLQRVEGAALLVKRRAGYLSYAQDPHASRSLMSRSIPKKLDFALPLAPATPEPVQDEEGEKDMKSKNDILTAFSDDPTIWAFVKHICHPRETSSTTRGADLEESTALERLFSIESAPPSAEEESLAAFSSAALYECISQDKPEMVTVFLHLWYALRAVARGDAVHLQSHIENFRIIAGFYDFIMQRYPHHQNGDNHSVHWTPLVGLDLIASARFKLKQLADSWLPKKTVAVALLSDALSPSDWVRIGAALKFLGIPSDRTILQDAAHCVQSTLHSDVAASLPVELRTAIVAGAISKLPSVKAQHYSARTIAQLAEILCK